MDFTAVVDLDLSEERFNCYPTFLPPLGLLYIGSILEKNGHNVKIIHLTSWNDVEDLLINDINPIDVIGVSFDTLHYKNAKKLIKMIKNHDPFIPVIIGGVHSTLTPKTSLMETNADICIQGEGEEIIIKVLESLEKSKNNFYNLPGVYFKMNGKIKKGKSPKPIKDLDTIPFPARHLVEKYNYGKIGGIYISKPKVTSILTSRGCPFRCRYCEIPTLNYYSYRERSVKNVVREIEEINDKYSSIWVADDNFLANKHRINQILDYLIQHDIKLDIYITGARVDSADRNLYQKMKKANVKQITFGIESGNQDVLDFYNKKITLNKIREAIDLSKEMGFITGGNFILGAPLETKKHIENTIKFACSLPLDSAGFSILQYAYGSDLWREAVESGRILKNQRNGEIGQYADSTIGLGNFTTKELFEYRNRAIKKFYFRPKYILYQLFNIIHSGELSRILYGINSINSTFKFSSLALKKLKIDIEGPTIIEIK